MAKTVMTVDDSPSVRQMVMFTLKQGGYEVIEAVDGRDGLAKLRGACCDMIITDLNMPNLDGIGMIREVRNDAVHRTVPIVMLTTESQEGRKQEGKTAGATGWIIKPFKPEQLLAVVKRVIG